MLKTVATLIASGFLIGAGASIIWLDVRKRRHKAFVSRRRDAPEADPEVEITIAHGGAAGRPLRAGAPPGRADAWGGENAETNVPANPPTLAQRWSGLQPAITASVDRANTGLAPARLFINTPGDPSWSYRHTAYGAYRRLLLGGESLGWLRLELTTEGVLRAIAKAHKDDRAEINATAETPAEGLTAARAGDLLAECLKPAVAYATRPAQGSEAEASQQAWQSVDPLVAAALKATNGALAQANAQLVTLAPPAWVADMRRHRMTLAIEVDGDDIARMHIERLPHEIEVAVGTREADHATLGRRRRIPVANVTIHGLAEMIASCAWPAIARSQEGRPRV